MGLPSLNAYHGKEKPYSIYEIKARKSHKSCEMFSLKESTNLPASERQKSVQDPAMMWDSFPVDDETVRRKKISKEVIFNMLQQLQEGDFDNGIIQRVTNADTKGAVLDTLF